MVLWMPAPARSYYPLGQKIEAEKNGDTVLIRGSPVGRGDYDL